MLYTATQHGVYISYDDGANWQELNPGLPDLPVVDLVVGKKVADIDLPGMPHLGSGITWKYGDGLVLAGRTLYAVEGGKNQITEISLAPDLSSGQVTDAITSPAFDVPTTAARFGNSLYAVNARFTTPPTPTTEYQVVRVTR